MLHEVLREAMDAAREVNWLEAAKEAEEKGNPFLNLLKSLRGEQAFPTPGHHPSPGHIAQIDC